MLGESDIDSTLKAYWKDVRSRLFKYLIKIGSSVSLDCKVLPQTPTFSTAEGSIRQLVTFWTKQQKRRVVARGCRQRKLSDNQVGVTAIREYCTTPESDYRLIAWSASLRNLRGIGAKR